MKKHILIILAENKPGVLNRVTSLCRQRRFNIENLTAGYTEKPGISHMTIVFDANKTNVDQVGKQIAKLIDVQEVKDMEYDRALKRETALIKVKYLKNNRQELLQLAAAFDAKVAHLSSPFIILEITAASEKIDDLVSVLQEFGIMEIKRTGVIAVDREKGS